VIATHTALQGERFKRLVARYASDVQVLTCVGEGLVKMVEAGALDTPETEALLREHLTPLLNAGADQVVLGCSHYPFLLPVIQRVVGPSVAVVDPSPAIARQTAHVLAEWGREADKDRVGRHVFCTTGAADRFAAMVQQLVPSFWNDTCEVCAARWRDGRLEAVA
jgi:glutamate racemase